MSGGGSEITTGSGCRGQAVRSACANGGPTMPPSASSSMMRVQSRPRAAPGTPPGTRDGEEVDGNTNFHRWATYMNRESHHSRITLQMGMSV